jgi:hypothetical protein
MIIKRYEVKDEDELLKLIDDDQDKLNGWEGPIEVHLKSARHPPEKPKSNVRAVK